MANLRQLRLDRGLTQSQVAAEVGVSRIQLSNIERGSVPRPANQKKIALFYGLRPRDLWPVEQALEEDSVA